MTPKIKIGSNQVVQELARRDFKYFVKATKKDFIFSHFSITVCNALNKFLKDVVAGKRPILIIEAPPQHGKLLPANTPILTTQGWKKHGDLKVGDFVFSDTGNPVRVLANSGVYKWPVCKIEMQGGINLFASPEHIFKIQADRDDHKGRREFLLETKDIFKSRNRRSPAILINKPLQIPAARLPIDPYLLGVWLGTGHKDNAYISCGKQDIKELSYLGKVRPVSGNFTILPQGLQVKLRKNNLLKNKHIPIAYLLSSIEQRKELLRGLMDTDGTCDKRGNCEFCQKEGRLAEDVYVLLRSLGYKPTRHTYDMKLYGRKVGRKVRILFKPNKGESLFKLPRKQARLNQKTQKDRDDKYKFFIKKITKPQGKCMGNCIMVEGGMYLAGKDLIPTHNSELTSRRFPAFAFGMNPDFRIAGCSYAADLAISMNRDLQQIMLDKTYEQIFPKSSLNTERVKTIEGKALRNNDRFDIVGHSGYYVATGVGGPLTGKSVDIGIIDDPIKNMQEALSETVKNSLLSWYNTVFLTRLSKNSGQLIMMTRWAVDDLVGEILKQNKNNDRVTRIRFPAINEKGEPLVPALHPLEQLLETKSTMSLAEWSAMYQQNPVIEGGNLFKESMFVRGPMPSSFDFTFITVDTAYKEKQENDYTVAAAWGCRSFSDDTKRVYLLDVFRERIKAADCEAYLVPFFRKWNTGNFVGALIEPKGHGIYLNQKMITYGLPMQSEEFIDEFFSDRRMDKVARANIVIPTLNTFPVIVSDNISDSMFTALKDELLNFPKGAHDDFCDNICDSIKFVYNRPLSILDVV